MAKTTYVYRLRKSLANAVAARTVAPPPAENLNRLNKADLVTRAEARGLDTDGTKADLIARLSDG